MVFDIDGVLVQGSKPIPGAAEAGGRELLDQVGPGPHVWFHSALYLGV